MEKIKQKKQINFAEFKLNPKTENLFDNCYKNDEFKDVTVGAFCSIYRSKINFLISKKR